jgi:hypothetical protein
MYLHQPGTFYTILCGHQFTTVDLPWIGAQPVSVILQETVTQIVCDIILELVGPEPKWGLRFAGRYDFLGSGLEGGPVDYYGDRGSRDVAIVSGHGADDVMFGDPVRNADTGAVRRALERL